MNSITLFRGPFFFLSNFYVDDEDGFCVEIVYQAAKAISASEREWVLQSSTPMLAKHRSYKIQKRQNWNDVRVGIMKKLLYTKFSRKHMRDALLATNDATLVEGNTHGDTFWGQCPLGTGENVLGHLLMEIRNSLREKHE